MHSAYRHTQTGTLLIWVLGLSIGACLLLGKSVSQPAVGPLAITGFTAAVLALCLFLFYSLTVEIDAEHLVFWFGPGLIRKRIGLNQIAACRVVRNRFWHGWGIHRYGNGWLYNVSGFDAVELTLQSGKQLRVGTDDPHQLHEAVSQVIHPQAPCDHND